MANNDEPLIDIARRDKAIGEEFLKHLREKKKTIPAGNTKAHEYMDGAIKNVEGLIDLAEQTIKRKEADEADDE